MPRRLRGKAAERGQDGLGPERALDLERLEHGKESALGVLAPQHQLLAHVLLPTGTPYPGRRGTGCVERSCDRDVTAGVQGSWRAGVMMRAAPCSTQIGKYKILEKIGEGAMGEVYKAHDPVLNRFVAVKTISAELGADDTLRKRFQREAQSAARLNHPNIITVFDFGEEQGKIYMAMELLEGADLKQAIARRAPLRPRREARDRWTRSREGLAFAHAQRHRAPRPQARQRPPPAQRPGQDHGLRPGPPGRLGHDAHGMVMGTPHYMSPEQVRGERADARSDVFSLGCVFYELLTGRKPFDADSMHAVLFKVMQEEPPAVHELAPGAPRRAGPGRGARDGQGPRRSASRTRASCGRRCIARCRRWRPVKARRRCPTWPLPPPALPPARAKPPPRARRRRPRSGPGPGAVRARVGLGQPLAAPGRPPAPAVQGPPAHRGRAAPRGGGRRRDARRAPSRRRSPPPPPTTRPAQVDGLAQELARSQVELARRRADAGDFRDAMRQAERALKIDPANKDAQADLPGRQSARPTRRIRPRPRRAGPPSPATTPRREPPFGPSSGSSPETPPPMTS